ncbi:hypothetical protein Taro_043346 [Colocasia esculenta]|uniref:Transposase (putative) gypsy type domain-containing protein n=1 Tax=Colocasia esculenta TaxID=4460 RepID=A0A843WJ66_COLES|nr:hypothetical protein [Colocasia esculenta]
MRFISRRPDRTRFKDMTAIMRLSHRIDLANHSLPPGRDSILVAAPSPDAIQVAACHPDAIQLIVAAAGNQMWKTPSTAAGRVRRGRKDPHHPQRNLHASKGEVQWLWTFRVAVVLGGRGVDANLRILQVIGSPEGRFSTLFSIPLAPVCCPGVPKAPSSWKTHRMGLGFLQGLRPKNLASTSFAAKLISQDVDGQIPCRRFPVKVLKRLDVSSFDDAGKGASVGGLSEELPACRPRRLEIASTLSPHALKLAWVSWHLRAEVYSNVTLALNAISTSAVQTTPGRCRLKSLLGDGKPHDGGGGTYAFEKAFFSSVFRLRLLPRDPSRLPPPLLLLLFSEMLQKGKAVAAAGASEAVPAVPQRTRYRFFEGLRERYRIGEEYDIVLAKEEDSYMLQKPGCIAMSQDLLEAGFRLPLPAVARDILNAWGIVPIQLMPNSWHTICIFCISCKVRDIELTVDLFRGHFSLAMSPQTGIDIFYTKHRANRMRIHFSPKYSNHKGWTHRVLFIAHNEGVPEWGFPTGIKDPRNKDMVPLLVWDAAKISDRLSNIFVDKAEEYLTEAQLVKHGLS